MKQKHVGILYLLYFLLFLVDCYATRISLYSSIGEGYGLAASLSHVLGACLLYWSQRDARAAQLALLWTRCRAMEKAGQEP